jgi:hypothetical protein
MGRLLIAERPSVRRRRPASAGRGQRRYREQLWRYVLFGDASTAVTSPVVYSLLLPFALLDAWVTVYQAICFRAWGIEPVRRRDYFTIDRHKLAYLNALEKMNCLYCSYANGVVAFVREVAARTEQYWCPIRHRRRPRDPHARYAGFVPYQDAIGYRALLPSLRALLRK